MALLLIPSLALVLGASGCATILRGTSQTVTFVTTPEGETAYFRGRPLKDGDFLTVPKRFGRAGDVRGDSWQAHCHRFQHRHR